MNVYLIKLYIQNEAKYFSGLELIWVIAKNEERAIELATKKYEKYCGSYPRFWKKEIIKTEVIFIEKSETNEEMTMWN